MAKPTNAAKRKKPIDHAVWIPRREAAKICQVSPQTILSWEGPRFRVYEHYDKNNRKGWYVHRDDVERMRLERIGPKLYELERYVLTELAKGKNAGEIVREGNRCTLGDVERIRDQDARLSDACVIDGATMRELRALLGAERLDPPLLLDAVRLVVERVNDLVGRLHAAAVIHSPTSPMNGTPVRE